MMNLLRYIGLPHLKQKPMRSLLTLLGIAFGIALYVAIAIINHSTSSSMKDSIEAVAGKAKLTISGGPVGFDESKLEVVKKVIGVKSAVPLIEARAYFSGSNETSGSLYVLGVDLLQEQEVRSYKTTDHQVIEDPLVFLNQADSIIITEKLATDRNLQMNSKMNLATANGQKTFTVRGILEPSGAARAYGGSLAIMDIDGARVIFGKKHKIDRIDIVPDGRISLSNLQRNLSEALGSSFRVETPDAQSSQTDAMLGTYQMILTFFSSIALLAGLFLIMNSISIAVAERRKEIGTLRALGATRVSMVILFVMEVIGIGFFGSVLGCMLGRLLAELLSKQVISAVATQFHTQIEVAKLDFTPREIAFSIVLGTGASVIAAVWPSLKAAKVHPLESMKGFADSFRGGGARFANRLLVLGVFILTFVTLSSVYAWGRNSVLLDALTKAGSVLGPAVFGPFIILFFLKSIENFPVGTFSAVFHFAYENLLKNPKRTISNTMALLVGLFLVMLIATIRTSFHDTLMDWLDQTFVSDVIVVSSGRIVTADVQPMNENIQNDILKVPGIRPLGTNRGAAVRVVRILYQNKNITVKAMDRYADFYESRYIAGIHAEPKALVKKLYESTEPMVLASDGFLLKQGKSEGDLIDLDTPNGKIPFRIGGTIADYAPDGVLYMDRKVYKKYWKDSLVSAFAFNILPNFSIERVRSEIDRRLAQRNNLMVVSNAEFKDQTQQAIEQSFAYTRAIEMIALVVGLLGLLNTMLISVLERTREIGMLRAVGATRGQISQMIFWEAVIQGFFGACVAVILGAFVGWLYVKYTVVDSLGWVMVFHFAFFAVAYTLFTGVLVAMIAGYFPSRRASSLMITEALEYE